MGYVVACSFIRPPSDEVSEALGLADKPRTESGGQHPEIWMSEHDFPEIEPALARHLASQEVQSAAFLTTMPVQDLSPILSRLSGRLAVHRCIADQVSPRWWTTSAWYQLIDLVSFAPAALTAGVAMSGRTIGSGRPRARFAETTTQYRDSLLSNRPTLIEAWPSRVSARLPDWFGDLADDQVGGANALLALSGATASSQSSVALRNPAAFGLRPVTGFGSLPVRLRTGQIEVHAVSIDAADPASSWRSRRSRARTKDDRLSALQARTGADYGVAITIRAWNKVDVLIEDGLVFEQVELNGRQNLAIAYGTELAVPAGGSATVALPAWSLNRELNPPAGEIVRPTSFYLPLPAKTDQYKIWNMMEPSDFLRKPT